MARYTLNPSLRGFSGQIDRLVFRRDGTITSLPKARNPRTPLQTEARRRLDLVANAWAGLTSEEARSWRRYAEARAAEGATSASGKPPRAYDLFSGLGCKFLQIHGGTAFPNAAPTRPFLGDAVAVSVEAVPGVVRFLANGPNGPDALTELLLQPLRNANRQPQPDRYRTQAFAAFSSDDLTFEVSAKPGAYAVAVRYVLGTTGQASSLVPLGVVVVTSTSGATSRLGL